MIRSIAAVVGSFLMAITAAPAMAASMTYDFYTNPCCGYPNVFPPGLTYFHGYFTVGDLPTNAVNYSAPISDWLFADGVTTVTPDSDYQISSRFDTNELGEITHVWVFLSRNGPYTSFAVGTNVYMNLRQSLIDDWANQNELTYCWNYDDSSPLCNDAHYSPAGDGYVTLRAVPVPGTLALFISGVAALRLRRRQDDVTARFPLNPLNASAQN